MIRLWISLIFILGIFPCWAGTKITSPSVSDALTATDTPSSSPVASVETKARNSSSNRNAEAHPFPYEEHLLATSATLPTFNRKVVEIILKYPRNGRHAYFWPRKGELNYDGCTTDVILGGRPVMKGEPQGRTYCCGLTLEVFYRALEALGLESSFSNINPDEFKRLWFCTELYARGPGDALEAYHLGRKVTPDEALPGDFVQIWRHNKSGHSVIFVGWQYDNEGRRKAIHYWSTQTGTQGINFVSESIGPADSMVWLEKTSFARADITPPAH